MSGYHSDVMPPDLSKWLTEKAAATTLQVSVRTIRRMAERREVERRTRPVEGRRPQPVFRPEDIERLEVERTFMPGPGSQLQAQAMVGEETGLQRATPALHPALVQTALLFEKLAGPTFERLASMLEAIKSLPAAPQAAPEYCKPWMTIQQAAVYTGLTEGYLRRQTRSGELYSIRDREGTKVRKADLDSLGVASQIGQTGRMAQGS